MKARVAITSPLVRLACSAIVLIAVAARVHPSELTLRAGPGLYLGLAGAAGLIALALAASAVRWALVLGPAAPPVTFLCRVYFIGWFFSLFLPTSVGGDAARAVALSRGGAPAGEGVASILLERILGVLALIAYFVVGAVVATPGAQGLLSHMRLRIPGWGVFVAIIVGVAAVACGAHVTRRVRALTPLLDAAGRLWREFRGSPSRMLRAVGVSLLVQALYILSWYQLGMALGLALPLRDLLLCVPLVSLAAMLPVTLSGLGVREGAWSLLLTPLGIASANAVAFSLSYYVAGVAVGLVGGLLFAIWGMQPSTASVHAAVLDVAATPHFPARS